MIINQRQRRLFQRRGRKSKWRRRRNVLRRCRPMIRWWSSKRVMILMISIYVWTDNYASIYQYYCLLLLQSLSIIINHFTSVIDLNYRCRNNFFYSFPDTGEGGEWSILSFKLSLNCWLSSTIPILHFFYFFGLQYFLCFFEDFYIKHDLIQGNSLIYMYQYL